MYEHKIKVCVCVCVCMCYGMYIPYCFKLWPVLYKRLVLFSCWGKQHYNKTKRQVLNERRVFCVPLIILSTWYFQAYSFPPSLSNMTDAGQ